MKLEGINSKINYYSKYSPVVLRLGISVILLWFGFSQLKNPANWTRLVPEYATSILSVSAKSLVYFNGTLEVLLGILLILGLYTRLVSFIITIHLFHIVSIVGYGPIGARDLTIAISSLAIFLHGSDEFCLERNLERKNKKENTSNKEVKDKN